MRLVNPYFWILVAYLKMTSHFVSYLRNYESINVFIKVMPHIKVVFLWPYARTGGVHPAYARAYAYAYHLCICIPPTQSVKIRKWLFFYAKYVFVDSSRLVELEGLLWSCVIKNQLGTNFVDISLPKYSIAYMPMRAPRCICFMPPSMLHLPISATDTEFPRKSGKSYDWVWVQYWAYCTILCHIIISFIKTKIKFYTTKLIHIKDMQLDM